MLFAIYSNNFPDLIAVYFFAALHEAGHIAVAFIRKYRLKKIKILPIGFNAVLDRPFKTKTDCFVISIAGPAVNLLLVLFLSFFRNEDFRQFIIANYYMFALNLLPIYPLDGGRIMSAIGLGELAEKSAEIIAYGAVITVLFSDYVINGKINVTLIFIFVFLMLSETGYKPVKSVGRKKEITVIQGNNKMIDIINKRYEYSYFIVYDDNKLLGIITEEEAINAGISGKYYITVEEYLTERKKDEHSRIG